MPSSLHRLPTQSVPITTNCNRLSTLFFLCWILVTGNTMYLLLLIFIDNYIIISKFNGSEGRKKSGKNAGRALRILLPPSSLLTNCETQASSEPCWISVSSSAAGPGDLPLSNFQYSPNVPPSSKISQLWEGVIEHLLQTSDLVFPNL